MSASRFPDAPSQISALPVEARGYPVPYFVTWIHGEPEFRAVDPRKIIHAEKKGLCWICGKAMLGRTKAFVIGPMCAVNRVSAEPPSHLDCARFAATACPFLTKPLAKRRPMDAGAQVGPPAGLMIERNPGVTLIWTTHSYRTLKEPNGLLFFIGSPVSLEWYAQGRRATRAEVMESIESGEPILRKQAALDGPEALALLDKMLVRAQRLLPQEAA